MSAKTVNKKGKMPVGYALAFSGTGLAMGINVLILMQITYYATDFAGLSPALVGTLLLASKIFDGVTDLLVGFVIEKTNTRIGKARPYQVMMVPLWICSILLFSIPNFGIAGKAAWLFVFYSLVNSIFATFIYATEPVMLGRSMPGDQQRAKVTAFQAIVIMMISAGVSIALPQLIKNWGSQAYGWTKILMAFGLPLMVIGLGRFLIKETVEQTAAEKNMKLKESLSLLLKNKYIFFLAVLLLIYNTVYNMGVVATYYFQYIVGDLGLLSIGGIFSLLSPFILILFPLAIRTIGSMGFVRIGLMVAIIANMLKLFIGPSNVILLLACNILASLGASPLGMMKPVFVVECMEYSEWKTGKRLDGFMSAMANFTSKVGGALASAGVGFIMALAGYVSGSRTQSGTALFSITALFTWIPAILCLLMLLVTVFYKLDKELPEIRKELSQRKTGIQTT